MFGTYFFALFDRNRDTWEHIPHTEGVYQLLSLSPTTPSPLPIGAIESLIDRTGSNGVVGERRLQQLAQAPKPGHRRFNLSDLLDRRVRVLSGPFRHWEGVAAASLKGRMRILLEIMGAQREVDVPFDQLELVEQT